MGVGYSNPPDPNNYSRKTMLMLLVLWKLLDSVASAAIDQLCYVAARIIRCEGENMTH